MNQNSNKLPTSFYRKRWEDNKKEKINASGCFR
ncbi:unnamed protein product [Lactuca saligna]|uniref:Uncharacterized protein n=1 Tax=Lactuca saligna TaxID=75948 RepID=A0AA36EKA0_LACSI|nr:unnamed protein product [Lactuca saligna]